MLAAWFSAAKPKADAQRQAQAPKDAEGQQQVAQQQYSVTSRAQPTGGRPEPITTFMVIQSHAEPEPAASGADAAAASEAADAALWAAQGESSSEQLGSWAAKGAKWSGKKWSEQ